MHSQTISTKKQRVQVLVNKIGDTLVQTTLPDTKIILADLLDKENCDTLVFRYHKLSILNKKTIDLQDKKIITLDKNSSRELDIRGQFVYEAIADLDDFINRALLNNYHEIKIIHGKGKLRAEIIKHLQTFKSITKCNSALPEHGGEGVTYVHF